MTEKLPVRGPDPDFEPEEECEYTDYVEQVLIPAWSAKQRESYYQVWPHLRPAAPNEIPVQQPPAAMTAAAPVVDDADPEMMMPLHPDAPDEPSEPEFIDNDDAPILTRPLQPAVPKRATLRVVPSGIPVQPFRPPPGGWTAAKVTTPFPRPKPPGAT